MVLLIISIYILSRVVIGYNLLESGSIGGYPSYSEYKEILLNIYNTYPDIVRIGNVTNLSSGETIPYIKLSIDTNYSSKGGILITAAMNTLQPLASAQVLYNVMRLLEERDEKYARTILKQSEIWYIIYRAVPIINIRAYQEFTNQYLETHKFVGIYKNLQTECEEDSRLNGIHLNRNFPYAWNLTNIENSTDPCSNFYQGSYPLEAEETAGIVSFIEDKEITMWIHYDG